MPNISYDTLSIKIEADSTQANSSISKLSHNLRNLDKSLNDLDTNRVKEVRGLLQSIAKIDFSNVTKGLQSVVTAFKALNTKSVSKAVGKSVGGDLEKVTPVFSKSEVLESSKPITPVWDFASVERYKKSLEDLSKEYSTIKTKGKEAVEVSNPFADQLTPLEQFAQRLYEIGFTGNQVKEVFKSIEYEKSTFSPEEIENLKREMTALGYSTEEVDTFIKRLKKDLDKTNENAKKGANGFQKLMSQFAKIMKYRIIRKIIQDIYKALTESVTNVIAFDKATSDTVNELKSKFEFLKNSLGAMLAPLIQMVAPILETIMQLVGELGNTFAEVFASANGQTQFAKASDDLRDFNEEAKKTQALGIDELNVMQQDQPKGFTMEDVKVGEKTQGIASAIKDIVSVIKNIIDKIKPVIQDLTSKILPAIGKLLTPIMEIIGVIVDLIMTLVGQTFEDVNSSLAGFIEAIGSILNVVSSIISGLKTVLVPIIHVISAVLNVINGVLGGAFKFISDIFNILEPIIDILNVFLIPLSAILTVVSTIFYVIEGVVKTIIKIVTLDWGHIGDVWSGVGENIKQAWNDMAKVANETVKKAPQFATGGFPEDGFFFANHNELVGQFSNGRTAVANNEQITQGIYEAVRDAMRESGGQSISIQIDGQELAKVIKKKQDNFGADLFVGGNLAYGK